MANPMRGEVDFIVDGKTHTLRLGVASIVLLEREFSAPLPAIMTDKFSNSEGVLFEDMATLFWAALQRRGQGPSKEDVLYLLDDAGIEESTRVFAELLNVSFSPGEGGNPQKADQSPTGGA